MEKEITTTNQTTALADSLIVVQQLPIIKEQLHSIKAQAQESVKEALSLACTEETLIFPAYNSVSGDTNRPC